MGHKLLQFSAFGLAAVIFAERMAQRVREKRSFSEIARAVELRIATAADLPEERSRRLNELLELRRSELNTLTAFRHGKTFLLAWLFYGASFVYSLLPLSAKSAGQLALHSSGTSTGMALGPRARGSYHRPRGSSAIPTSAPQLKR